MSGLFFKLHLRQKDGHRVALCCYLSRACYGSIYKTNKTAKARAAAADDKEKLG